MKMKKQNLGWILSTILVLIMLSYIGFLYLNSQVEKGIEEGILIGQEEIILKINQNGAVPVISQEQEELYVDWINIEEICGGTENNLIKQSLCKLGETVWC